jgi:hypothetical protein
MPSVADALGSKPPLGSALADGIRALSSSQQITFDLYRKYVFPLDGMVYWIKLPTSTDPVTTAGIQVTRGLAAIILAGGETIQAVPGSVGALDIVGGIITNPLSAADQGIPTAEPLFVDFTGPAYSSEKQGTTTLQPGESIEIPPVPSLGGWVNAHTTGHQFTVVVQHSVSSVTLATQVNVLGSFHYDSIIEQREDATVDSNTVIFSSLSEIQEFNNLGPDYLYIASYRNIRFAFASRGRLYEQADLYHYLGKALFSVNATQIIDDVSTFNPDTVISNSLPLWLNLPNYVPPYPGFICSVPLYPSFLVTDNLPPPFGSVHIEDTKVLTQSPIFGPQLQQTQWARDRVRVNLYGLNRDQVATFLAFVMQWSRDWNLMGMANMPNITDVKHSQPEMRILAQRKRIDFEVNYNDLTVRDQARQFIEHAKVQYIPAWLIT